MAILVVSHLFFNHLALTLSTFLRHRKEMNDFLSSGRNMTRNKYNRLMVIACLDTAFNVPMLIINFISDILRRRESPLNHPYKSWENVHDDEGGLEPGLSLSSIVQTPARAWSTTTWNVFALKWDEWVYVLHAIIFFSVFGTTPEMRQYYRSAFWFIPKRCGYKIRSSPKVETLPDIAFNPNPGQQVVNQPTVNR